MWVATLENDTDPEDEPFYFASLDNERFIGVSRLPLAGEEDAIETLLKGTHVTLPMTVARRLLAMEGAQFSEVGAA